MIDKNPNSAWTIVAWLVLGIVILDGIPRLYAAYQYRQAMKAFSERMVELRHRDADPFGWRAAADSNNRRAAADAAAEMEANALKPGERCIGGQRFAYVNDELRDIGTC